MTTSTTDAEAIARKAVTRIIDDLTDRRGLRHAWDGIDDDIRAEIESTWTMIIRTSLASRREAQEPVTGELLPCPFCGGAAETDSQQAYRNISTGYAETAVAVYCTACGAQHTICRGDVPDAELSDVTELWNKRTAPPAPAGEAERLREAQEPVDWIYEDELPSSYPYGRMFAYSKVRDGVRMFPVYAPSPAPAGEVEMLRGALEIAREVHFKAASIASGLPKEDPEHLRWLHHSYGADEVAYKIDAALNGGRHD